MFHQPYDMPERRATWDSLECRGCGVVCERVVYPSHCLRSSCLSVYAFSEGDVVFFGCLHKVFRAEIDLAPHLARPRSDVYGAWKARREPLESCRSEVMEAYPFHYSFRACTNPTFRHHPSEYTPEAVRQLVEGTGDPPR